MKSGTFSRVMTNPLKAPTANPAASPSSRARGSGQPQWAKATPMRLPDSAAVDATDRSMPAETMTRVWPTARIAGTEYWRSTLRTLSAVRKSGVAMKNPSTSSSRMATAPPRPPAAVATRTAPARAPSSSRARPPPRPSPVTSAMHPSRCRHHLLLGGVRVDRADDPAAGHDEDPVGQLLGLAGLRGQVEDGRPVAGQPPHQPEHLLLGADVDAPGRVVEHQHPRPRAEPSRQDQLLLVAARQRLGRPVEGGPDVQLVGEAPGQLPLLAGGEQGAPSQAGQRGQGDVLGQGHAGDDAGGAVLAQVADAEGDGVGRGAHAGRPAADLEAAAGGRLQAEQGPGQAGAAGADQPEHRRHLPRPPLP